MQSPSFSTWLPKTKLFLLIQVTRIQPRTEGLPHEITQLPLTYNLATKSSSLGEKEEDGWQSAVYLRLRRYGLELL